MNTMNRRLFASAAAAALLAPALAAAQEAPPVDKAKLAEPSVLGEMALGKEDAKVTIVEYASSSCPHCAEFAELHLPKLQKDYIDTGKVRLVFREFPHNDAGMGGFMVARCAPKEKYFPIVDVLFKTQQTWVQNPLEGLKAIALQAGFTEETFLACLNNKDVAQKILDVRQKAETFGIQGIPSFFINGERFKGEPTYDALKVELDKLLG
jgi:protein-disulfide isomerase